MKATEQLSTVSTTQVKYGLVIKKNPSTSAVVKGVATGNKMKAKSDYFDQDDDDNDDDNDDDGNNNNNNNNRKDIAKVNASLLRPIAATATATGGKGVLEDVYDFDGQYDQFKAEENNKQQQALSSSTNNAVPRYIKNIKNMATLRTKERERVFERKLLKEQQQQQQNGQPQEQFITSAYRQKLIEEEKWKQQEKISEELELRTDVRSKVCSACLFSSFFLVVAQLVLQQASQEVLKVTFVFKS